MITDEMLTKLTDLKAQPKFKAEPGTIYNGLRPEEDRQLAELQLNELIARLIQTPRDRLTNEFVLAQFAQSLSLFPGQDTEDRERMCLYLEQIMDIFGIESSEGLLNRWMYGFDPNDLGAPQT
jgi:uncharacterized protein DUF4844